MSPTSYRPDRDARHLFSERRYIRASYNARQAVIGSGACLPSTARPAQFCWVSRQDSNL